MFEEYEIDIKLTGFARVKIYADSIDDARERASEYFKKQYMQNPINNLRWISTEYTHMHDGE